MSVSLLTLAACAAFGPGAGVAVTVTPESAGRAIELRTDQALLVRLPSNLVTDYRWSLAAAPSDVLKLEGLPAFERDTTGSGAVGASGTEIWRFTTARKGQQTLLFDYRLPWETDAPPVRQLWFTVTVR